MSIGMKELGGKMIKKKILLRAAIVLAALSVVFIAIGVVMKIQYTSYQGEQFSFAYPGDWNLRESKGSTERYFQAHVFGKPEKESKWRPSVTVTVYPKKEAGGSFATLDEFFRDYVEKTRGLKGFNLIEEKITSLPAGLTAKDIQMDFIFHLPLYDVNAKDVLMKERTLFFEKETNLFVVSYKNLSKEFTKSHPAFRRVLASLKVK